MATKYVLPQHRSAIVAPPLESTDLSSLELFPQLGEAKQSTWTGKSFKQTIDDLIAYEKLSEQEKNLKEMKATAMDGWHVLPNVPREWVIKFNEKILQDYKEPEIDTFVYQPNTTANVKVTYTSDDEYEYMAEAEYEAECSSVDDTYGEEEGGEEDGEKRTNEKYWV